MDEIAYLTNELELARYSARFPYSPLHSAISGLKHNRFPHVSLFGGFVTSPGAKIS
jgi:hypothetical protein